MQYMCVFVPHNQSEAKLMEEVAINIILNIAVCWLKLNEFEFAKQQCHLIMELDLLI